MQVRQKTRSQFSPLRILPSFCVPDLKLTGWNPSVYRFYFLRPFFFFFLQNTNLSEGERREGGKKAEFSSQSLLYFFILHQQAGTTNNLVLYASVMPLPGIWLSSSGSVFLGARHLSPSLPAGSSGGRWVARAGGPSGRRSTEGSTGQRGAGSFISEWFLESAQHFLLTSRL